MPGRSRLICLLSNSDELAHDFLPTIFAELYAALRHNKLLMETLNVKPIVRILFSCLTGNSSSGFLRND
jgi:hypothetical protein